MNIKLHYLYRDGANYKQYHYEVYTNVQGLSLEEIEHRLREQLIDGEWFYNHNWDLKDLHHHPWDNSIDHTWHKFNCIAYSDDAVPAYGWDCSGWRGWIGILWGEGVRCEYLPTPLTHCSTAHPSREGKTFFPAQVFTHNRCNVRWRVTARHDRKNIYPHKEIRAGKDAGPVLY